MAQPRRSYAASTAPSKYQLYKLARKRVFRHLDLLEAVTDPASARDWVSLFGRSMVCSEPCLPWGHRDPDPLQSHLSDRGDAVGIDPAEDTEVRALLGDARSATINFATAEWIDLSPDLVIGLERSLRELAPGEMLGSAFPPAPSASSRLSGIPVPPISRNSSSSSGVPRSTSSAPTGRPGHQAVRSHPRARFLEARQSSPGAAAPPPASAVTARKASFVSDPGERPRDWVTVRHSPRNFPVILDTLPA